ncbi:MAG: 50S ribosomal protein L29 [Acidobacteria bacterium]|nr:50S ribosomal protein L29 [Acidobacteriota bacterium]
MKPAEIRELSDEELLHKERELAEQIYKLRFQLAAGQLDNPMKLRLLKRDLARVKTVMRERELQREVKK